MSDFVINDLGVLTEYIGSSERVIIPDGVLAIGQLAFSKNPQIREVVFNDCLRNIGYGAFFECSNLRRIVLPMSLESIEDKAFGYCTSLESVDFGEVRLLQSIGEYCFACCETLDGVSLPYGLVGIGEGCFFKCSSLKSISFPESFRRIGKGSFQECVSLESVVLNDGIESIGEGAFYELYNLKRISLGSSLTEIGAGAFYKTSLKNIEIPGGIKLLGNAFGSLNGYVDEITVGEGCEELGEYAFEYCRRLNLPSTIVKIDARALKNVNVFSAQNSVIQHYCSRNRYDNRLTWTYVPSESELLARDTLIKKVEEEKQGLYEELSAVQQDILNIKQPNQKLLKKAKESFFPSKRTLEEAKPLLDKIARLEEKKQEIEAKIVDCEDKISSYKNMTRLV